MKKCFKCGEVKTLDCFYKHSQMADGHLNKCKECNKKDVRYNYSLKQDYYQKYDRERNLERKEYLKLKDNEWRLKNKEKSNTAKNNWAKKNNKKINAQSKARRSLNKKIIYKNSCIFCGNIKAEGHHHDYDKPLDVIWLCDLHHKKVHWFYKFIDDFNRNKKLYWNK